MKLKNKAILALALSISFVMASTSLADEPAPGAQPGAQASELAAPAENNENNSGGGTGSEDLGQENSSQEEEKLELNQDYEEPAALQAVNPDNTDGTTKEDFSKAIDPKFDGIKAKENIYEGSYDKEKREVTVKILDPSKKFSELKGTGLIAGLNDLYKNNNLVKIKVGDSEVRDLVAIGQASADDTAFLQNLAQIVGSDIGLAVKGQGQNINSLADFVGGDIVLKLTIKTKEGKEETIDYHIKGVSDNKHAPDLCPIPEKLKEDFSTKIDPMFDGIKEKPGVYEGKYDKDKKEVTVKILDEKKSVGELRGTGLAAGLADLYENDNLVKVKVGDEDERDLVAISNAVGNDKTAMMQAFAQIFGADIGNAIDKSGADIKLGTFIGKRIPLKLTIKKPGCEEEITLTYYLNGVDKDGKVPPKKNPEDKPEDKPQPKPSDDYNYDFYLPSKDDDKEEKKEESKDGRSDEELIADIEETDKEINDVLDKNEEKKKEENKEKEDDKKPSKEKESDVENKKKKSKEAPGKKGNPKTGVASVGYLGGLAAISMAGIVASRKRK